MAWVAERRVFANSSKMNMTTYWWVNHKQTFKHEIDGEYLWSPKVEKSGARSTFYNNMREAVPGDIVVSYAFGKISYIGEVADYAFTSPKPAEFGKAGVNWATDGWLLPVTWYRLQNIIALKSLLPEIADTFPEKYSPVNVRTGRGNQKAYLAKLSERAFQIIVSHAGANLGYLKKQGNEEGRFISCLDMVEDGLVAQIANNRDLTESERAQLIKARKGQGLFRRNVQLVETACRITGVDNDRLLIASHIKPWRVCSNTDERLDGANGLLLTPTVDLLFDRGLISFNMGGVILRSSRLSTFDVVQLGLESPLQRSVGHFSEAQEVYLSYHRSNVYLP
jgi:hypothetical protein